MEAMSVSEVGGWDLAGGGVEAFAACEYVAVLVFTGGALKLAGEARSWALGGAGVGAAAGGFRELVA